MSPPPGPRRWPGTSRRPFREPYVAERARLRRAGSGPTRPANYRSGSVRARPARRCRVTVPSAASAAPTIRCPFGGRTRYSPSRRGCSTTRVALPRAHVMSTPTAPRARRPVTLPAGSAAAAPAGSRSRRRGSAAASRRCRRSPPKLPSIWNGGCVSNRFGSVDLREQRRAGSRSAWSPSSRRAQKLMIHARLQPVRAAAVRQPPLERRARRLRQLRRAAQRDLVARDAARTGARCGDGRAPARRKSSGHS